MPTDWKLEATLAYLRHLADEDKQAEEAVRRYRDYFAGDHPVYITDRQAEFLGISREVGKEYVHNICELVVASVVERLHLTGFTPVEDVPQAKKTVEAVTRWWRKNQMDAGQDDVHEAACIDTESYIIVEWPKGTEHPTWTLNRKYNGTEGVKLHRDPVTGRPLFASKRWQVTDPATGRAGGATRITLYYPDRIEKWISTDKGDGHQLRIGGEVLDVNWKEYQGEDGSDPWPIWWTDNDEPGGEPLGLSVVGFQNPGGSEIHNLLPIQDALNKSDVDLLAAQDISGWRILWTSGAKAQIDPSTGERKSIKVQPAKLISLPEAGAKLGAIEPADLTKMISVSKYWMESAAGVTRTPQYLFEALGADQPSGESLKQREVGLISKVERKQRRWGNAWEAVAALSVKLWNKYRPGESLPLVDLSAQWQPAELENTAEEIDVATKKRALGIPRRTVWAEIGYDADEIEQMEHEQAAETERENNIGAAILRNFDQGG